MAIAVLIVVGVVVAMVALSGGKKKDDGQEGSGIDIVKPEDNQPKKPAEPQRPPPPRIDNDKFSKGRELINQMKPLYKKAAGLYDDAQMVKEDDPEMWQKLLREANDALAGVNDLWGEIEGMMPGNNEWPEDQVANHYFGKLYSKVGKVDELKMAIRKNIRSK